MCKKEIEILLVDDYPENTNLLQNFLTDYKTFAVDNGADALSVALEYKPALILLDVNMPVMDGFEVCQILKGNEGTRDILIIFITGLAEPDDIAKGFQLGAVDYVTKPFNLPEIKARINTHLSLHKTRCVLEKQNDLLTKTVREQQINASLARKILGLINGDMPRYVELGNERILFAMSLSKPCKLEGGDHCLVKTMTMSGGGKKTVLSLKDQSGHSVNCLLRSIVTDFFHNQLLAEHNDFDVGEIFGCLNSAICKADFFADDDFCTAFGAELIHEDLKLRYLSAGHPPMLLIRQDRVIKLPDEAGESRNLPLAVLPDVAFQAGTVQLRHGDKLIIYTDGLNALPKGDPLRQQELIDLVSDIVAAMPEAPVSGLVRELLNRLGAFAEGKSHTSRLDNSMVRSGITDDLSILALDIEGSGVALSEEFFPVDFKNFEDFLEAANDCLPKEITQKDEIRMAVAEALINAWRHGNGEDFSKAVSLRWWKGNDWNVEVADRGNGFNPNTVPDPTMGENLLSEAGRGIFTMRKFCAWLRWRDGGRKVILSFDN